MKATVILITALLASGAPANPRPDALTLLKNVCQQYADAKSYHIEAIQEQTISNELERSWYKELLSAAVAPGGKYRYEGRSGHGSGILVSDGETRWAYHLNEHLYTKTLVSVNAKAKSRIMLMEEMAAENAKRLVQSIVLLPTQFNSAAFLRDQRIEMNGRRIKCRVIHLAKSDFKTRDPELKREETLWIDESRNVVLKIQSRTDSYSIHPPSSVHIPILIEETTLYPVVQLGGEQPANSFTFSPPQDAKLIDSFPDTMMHPRQEQAKELVGKLAPDIQMKQPDGGITSLTALRGKPVFIEFWATWCGPCLDLMPELKDLYAQTAKSIVWLSIDNDEDPHAAKTYLSQQHISWPNYHDDDGSLGKEFERNGIPLGVLIDAAGKITFYEAGYDISDLRAAIAKLSPSGSPLSATEPK